MNRTQLARTGELSENEKLASLAGEKYLRERLDPKPGDELYLHLSDLITVLRDVAKEIQADRVNRLLDFGCGGSPYRTLFPDVAYFRADIAGVANLDYQIQTTDDRCVLEVESNSFDIVLSSQVLEHVPEPSDYLREAFRVLKPGGKMVLSTHGVFEDHGCPYDFRRWTSYGLERDIAAEGFEVQRMIKLTTGPRAVMFLMQQQRPRCKKRGLLGWWLYAFRHLMDRHRSLFDRQCDHYFAGHRVVERLLEDHRIYIALLTVSTKPA